MDALNRLVPYYRKFNGLPFVVQRVALIALFLGCFVAGAKVFPHYESLGFMFLMTAWFGLVWSTGLWRLWKPLSIILVIYLRMFI